MAEARTDPTLGHARHAAVHAQATTRRGVRIAVAAIAVIAAGFGLFLILDAASVHFVAANSDGATVVLEGQSMQRGSLLLSGWSLPLDSFFTTEVPFYALAVALFGVGHGVVNGVPTGLATVVIVVGAVLAWRSTRGWRGLLGAGVVVALLGFPSAALSFFLLQGPWHIGTALVCLVGFVGASSLRFGWRSALAVVCLAAGLLGDVQTLALGVVPVAIGGGVAATRARRPTLAVPPIVVAASSVVLAYALRRLFDAIGTFGLVNANPTARIAQIGTNLRDLPSRFAGMLGVGTVPIGPQTTPSHLPEIHLVVLVVVLAGVLLALVGLCRGVIRGDRSGTVPVGSRTLDDLLVLGFVGDLGAFVILAATGNGDYARYLTAGVIFAAVLLGRQVSRLVPSQAAARLAFFALGAVGMALVVVGFALDFELPAVSRPADALGTFLAERGLTNGLGDYWSASIVTTSTGGAVTVRPVISTPAGTLARYGRQTTATWYRDERFSFLVYDLHRPWRSVGEATAVATFGEPKAIFAEGTYRVFVFARPVKISDIGYSNA